MKKEKSKRRPYPARGLLIAATCLMGFFCLTILFRPLTDQIFYFSKRLPYDQRYQLTGDSYLSDWSQDSNADVSVTRTDSVLQTRYHKSLSFFGSDVLEAEITFIYYDNVHFTDELYEEKALRDSDWGSTRHGTGSKLGLLLADHARIGCDDLFYGHDCIFIGEYGSCLISVISHVEVPYVSSYDYEDLIENYIDPQMAAWDVCYPDRQAG
jgi:hypothetical protein